VGFFLLAFRQLAQTGYGVTITTRINPKPKNQLAQPGSAETGRSGRRNKFTMAAVPRLRKVTDVNMVVPAELW
jgi:hypothetical protein